MNNNKKLLLVGDNPFHGVSHLSQQRAIARGKNLYDPQYASQLVCTALENGADGFMFSVSNTNLNILKIIREKGKYNGLKLYAIVPNVSEFVRMATVEGGIPGLAKKIGGEIASSGNLSSIFYGLRGFINNNPDSLLKAYLLYEESRIGSASSKSGIISTIFIHELVTDLALSLNMEWVFKTHIDFMNHRDIKPGFHTHNLPYLISKLKTWGINCKDIAFTTQYNSLGFWMSPSREETEAVLKTLPGSEVIAYGILASGYLKLPEAVEYIKGFPQLTGLAFGVSKEHHARETFEFVKSALST